MISTKISSAANALTRRVQYNKINWTSGNPYNLRWQYKWKHAYYTYPRDGFEATQVKKPEDSPDVRPPMFTYFQDLIYRAMPSFRTYWERRSRLMDPFQIYFLPGFSLFFYQFADLNIGFQMFTVFPWLMFYTRMRDKCGDPDIKEVFLRDMIHQNEEISQLFSVETIHALDYDLEYDAGYPDEAKFPEFKNKLFRFFNADTHMATGFFKFGDLESGATMNLKVFL